MAAVEEMEERETEIFTRKNLTNRRRWIKGSTDKRHRTWVEEKRKKKASIKGTERKSRSWRGANPAATFQRDILDMSGGVSA